ncbi:hypothetical protein IH992_21805 [Candidatus Poribacteria bacterium]|nr:hypothetical protein [Candidatus Poribacteria bacterium]
MAYSDFNLATVQKAFSLTLKREDLFENIKPIEASQWLKEALDMGIQLAFNSEKARSEFLVVPILLTGRELSHNSFSIYSGERLDVEPDSGLVGECDFILTNTPPLPIIQAPIVVIVEAKKNDIEGGLGQCVAQMLGAKLFNQKEDNPIDTIFGCVTTGESWQFLKLENDIISINSGRHYINKVGEILGMLQAIVSHYKPYATAA